MADVKDKKTCFVITPIGDSNSDIRRHIDGIIDQAIVPALGEKYEIEVAHRKYEIGSINDRVVKSVFEADLVIANLTNINPNVMYELAIRYSFGKPAIVMAEKGTKLPFDVIDENTIFYINDPAGADELRQNIIKFEKTINFENQKYGPVYKVVNKVPLYNEVESGDSENISNEILLQYVIDRLDSLEKNLNAKMPNKLEENFKNSNVHHFVICFEKNTPFEESEIDEIKDICSIYSIGTFCSQLGNTVKVECIVKIMNESKLWQNINDWLKSKQDISYRLISSSIIEYEGYPS